MDMSGYVLFMVDKKNNLRGYVKENDIAGIGVITDGDGAVKSVNICNISITKSNYRSKMSYLNEEIAKIFRKADTRANSAD